MKSYLDQVTDLRKEHLHWISATIDPMVEQDPTWMTKGNDDCKTEYRKNNYGLRSDDFNIISDKNKHILFAGDEKTLAQDLDESQGWANQLYNHLGITGLSFNNLSYPGASIYKISSNLFKYFKAFGNPKILFLLVPDLARDIGFWDEAKAFKPKIYNQYRKDQKPEHYEFCSPNNMPMQILGLRYLHEMRMIEQYCDASEIELYWTSSDIETNYFLQNFEFEHFFHIAPTPGLYGNDVDLQKYISDQFIEEMESRRNNVN